MARVAKHREALVRTGMRLFRRQGYASTGLQQILTEAGVPKGSLYHHFPGGKLELAEAAVDLAGALVAEMLEALAERHPGDPAGFVVAYCRTMAGWMQESDFRAGCPVATTLLETVPQSAALTAAGNRVFDRWVAIAAGVFAGAGYPPAQARRRGQSLVAAVEGALLLTRVRQSNRPLRDVAALDWR